MVLKVHNNNVVAGKRTYVLLKGKKTYVGGDRRRRGAAAARNWRIGGTHGDVHV